MTVITIVDLTRQYKQYKRLTLTSSWQRQAACKGEEVDIFLNSNREVEAKRFCADCPVADQCLAFAIQTPNLAGVYGGVGEKDRDKAYRRQRQGNKYV